MFCLVFWTAKDLQEAKKIGKALLEKKLVACITFFPEVESLFVWEGKVEGQKEVKVLFKTKKEKMDKIIAYIQEESSYEVPEILQVPVEKGNPAYLGWMEEILS